MASKKVLEIREILSQDNLAKQLVFMYNNWSLQRMEKEAEWRELRNYLFATDTTKTTNSKLPWKNKTTLPKLTQIRDNLHANYTDATFPNDDWLRWEGYSQDDVTLEKRRTIEAYMKNKCRESGFRETISQLLYDYIDYGNCFADVIWENNSYKDPVTGETIVNYIGPKVVRISPFDITFNPISASFKDSPKFIRFMKTVGELKKQLQVQPELKFNEEAFNKIISTRNRLNSFEREDIAKAEALRIDGFGSLQEYYQSGIVELLEFRGTIYDQENDQLLENRIITIADRSTILRNIPDPSWLGQDNLEHVGWRDRPDNLYGMGPLDNLVGLQYRLDHLENLKADALDQTILPPKVIIGEVEPFEWGPDANIHVPEDGDVRTLPPNAAAFQVNNEIGSILAIMEEMAGAPKEAMGIRTPGEKTAFEVQTLQNAAGRIFQHKVNKFEIEFMEKLLNTMLEVARRNMDSGDLIRVLDDDLGVTTFINIKKEDITAKGHLRPVGSRHYATRAQLLQNLSGVFNSQIGAMITPHVSAKKLASLIEDVMGFEKYEFIKDNVMVFEQAETQKLINEQQQGIEAEASVPVQEELLSGNL